MALFWSAVLVLLLLLGPRPVPAHEASSLLALLPDVKLLPAPSAASSLAAHEEGRTSPPCDQLRILPDDRDGPCQGSPFTLAALQESEGEETPAFEPAQEKPRPTQRARSFRTSQG